ncbi:MULTISPECIES: MltR family transcriptional regulator [Vibrio]|uniref:MltR family transcriptional regulator n=2 Tax=Vibrio TaxID=662 RepID=A0A7X4RWI8_9VIBR|nr:MULTISPECIES: MltR family transcriptional regulator [Vibrio]MBF9003051.1 MltR family transcriptional regulator [Vibrio nitrifigilis]MZI95392.1 MltR family transcriptional regulator [Vibrio eleionomae]
MVKQINESEIIERLNLTPSVRGFFIAASEIIAEAVESLMQRIFLKDNFAVQSVVGPLLHDSGPLGDVQVRLKLLYGLGVVSDSVFHDIETIIKLKNQLNADGLEHEFTDTKVTNAITTINAIKQLPLPPFELQDVEGEIDLEFYQLQVQRRQQMIRSSLALVVIEICNNLNIESPF